MDISGRVSESSAISSLFYMVVAEIEEYVPIKNIVEHGSIVIRN